MKLTLFSLILVSLPLLADESLRIVGDASGIRIGSTSLDCQPDGTFETGRRYRCGTQRPYVEILMSYGDRKGAAVAHIEVDGEKANQFFNCEVEQRKKDLRSVRCEEVGTDMPSDENKLLSPINPSLPGSTIPNSHLVPGEKGRKIMRGMAPRKKRDYQTLRREGIEDVIIFKTEVRGDVGAEKKLLTEKYGWKEKNVHWIAFPWRDLPDFKAPCLDTLKALQVMRQSRAVFFHCTVGEDRTGYLAGIYRLLTTGEDYKRIFREEMCEHGYSFGNPKKPFDNVVLAIHRGLTRLYLKMAFLAKQGKLDWARLDDSICENDPAQDDEFMKSKDYAPSAFVCGSSTRFRP